MREISEKTRTAPAAMSFALPAFWLYSGLIKSTIASIAELINSREIVIPMQIKSIHQSVELTFKKRAASTVKMAQIKMIFRLRCLKPCAMPLSANENDFKNEDIRP